MANKKSGGNTVSIVTALVTPLIEQLELELWDVKFEKEGSIWILRVIIDKDDEAGITVDDCAAVSRPLDKLLDDADPIEQSYCLEVASAGLERELSKQWHFDKFIGTNVLVRLIRPLNGERDFLGELLSFADNTVTIKMEAGDVAFTMADVAFVRLVVEF